MKNKDKFFSEDISQQDFKFDKDVVNVFDDMVSRSVPCYDLSQAMAISLAEKFITDNSTIVDLGCSTATLLIKLQKKTKKRNLTLIGFDNSQAMLDAAKKKLKKKTYKDKFEFKLVNLEDELDFNNSSVVFMNYTLQFIRPLYRENLLKNIFKKIKKNGCLILMEKVLENNSMFNRMYIDLYYEYKNTRGYSKGEISRKREALENVLIPYRTDENMKLLKDSGFKSVDTFFKWFNWVGIIAVKN